MPVDKITLKQMIKDIDAKILELRNKQTDLFRIKDNLDEIVELEEQSITDAGVVTVKVHKSKNKRTGKDFTPGERQKVYDDNIADAAVALAV